MMTVSTSNNKKLKFTLAIFMVGVFLFLISYKKTNNILTVAFLDVGQGDAIFIEAPNGNQVLIDSGASQNILRKLSEVMNFSDRSIDILIPTHADKDHIGGFPEILERYEVKMILESHSVSDTNIFKAFEEEKIHEDPMLLTAFRGQTIVLDQENEVYIKVLFPHQDASSWKDNDASTVVQIVYGEVEFLLTGDASSSVERLLMTFEKESLESNVLKLGHHGSKTSSDKLFLKEVNSNYTIVSASATNSYGHPAPEVIKSVIENTKSEILETSKEGNIVFLTDGEKTWLK